MPARSPRRRRPCVCPTPASPPCTATSGTPAGARPALSTNSSERPSAASQYRAAPAEVERLDPQRPGAAVLVPDLGWRPSVEGQAPSAVGVGEHLGTSRSGHALLGRQPGGVVGLVVERAER